MKNEKYIAPEMEVVEVKADSVLMWSGKVCAPDTSGIIEPCKRFEDVVLPE